jgi:hypothetical protein
MRRRVTVSARCCRFSLVAPSLCRAVMAGDAEAVPAYRRVSATVLGARPFPDCAAGRRLPRYGRRSGWLYRKARTSSRSRSQQLTLHLKIRLASRGAEALAMCSRESRA